MSKALRTEIFGHKKLYFNWRLMLVRVMVNSIAIGVTAFLLPSIRVTGNSIGAYFLLGIAFGLLNAFIKPIVQFFTISLIFITYGLVIVVIHTIMLLLLEFFMPDYFQISSLWGAMVGGILIGLLSMILDNIFGLTPPILDFDQPSRDYVTYTAIEGIGFVERDDDQLRQTNMPQPSPVIAHIVNNITNEAAEKTAVSKPTTTTEEE